METNISYYLLILKVKDLWEFIKPNRLSNCFTLNFNLYVYHRYITLTVGHKFGTNSKPSLHPPIYIYRSFYSNKCTLKSQLMIFVCKFWWIELNWLHVEWSFFSCALLNSIYYDSTVIDVLFRCEVELKGVKARQNHRVKMQSCYWTEIWNILVIPT